MAFEQIVRTYTTPAAFEADAARVAPFGWAVTSTTERTPPTSCMRVFMLGIIGAALFKPAPEIVAIYRRELTGDEHDARAALAFPQPAQPRARSSAPPAVSGQQVTAGVLAAVMGVVALFAAAIPEIVQYATTGKDVPTSVGGVNIAPLVSLVTFGVVAVYVYRRRRAGVRPLVSRQALGIFALWSVGIWALYNLFATL